MAKHAPQLRDERTPGWFYIDDSLIDTHGQVVGAIGVAIYAALARHAKANGRVIASYDQIARSLDLSRNTVITKLRILEAAGLITISPQTDDAGNPIAANVYTLCVIPEQKREIHKRGVPTVEPPVPTDERGVPTDAYIGHDSFSIEDHDPPPPPNPPRNGGGGGGGRKQTGPPSPRAKLFLRFNIGRTKADELSALYAGSYPDVSVADLEALCVQLFDRTINPSHAGYRLYQKLLGGPTTAPPKRDPNLLTIDNYKPPPPLVALDPERARRIFGAKERRDAS